MCSSFPMKDNTREWFNLWRKLGFVEIFCPYCESIHEGKDIYLCRGNDPETTPPINNALTSAERRNQL